MLLSIVFSLVLPALPQSSSQKAAVLLSATVQSSPTSITVIWESSSNTSSISIYRKLKSETSWGGAIANPSTSSTEYQDNSVQSGVAYEYKVVRSANGVTGTGYISTGIEVALPDYRGKLILLVDNTLAPQMVSELTQLQKDLKGDGWAVIREDVSRTAPASSIRSIVTGHYNSDPSTVKAVYVVGHVPVPYSGNAAPDGHSEHVGAWPCDGYYGEMSGSWTDNSVNNTGAARQANRNIPGDGKFDQSNFPSDLELQVGRVDLYDMPAFSQGEVQLMKNYLNRAHSFKIKGWTPLMRGMMFDNLQWVSNPIAGCGWRSMGPLVGASNITNANQ
ncbi:MAG: fibronectin type III domain-containing protein, partial [Bacteroidota bacterium]|nr:fibronectin type III domain-containing protein [Bacteroidota bacterium]